MKLSHPFLSYPIEFSEDKINVLVIENQKALTQFVTELLSQLSGCDGNFIISDELKLLPIDKHLEVIVDFFAIDINQRKLHNKLYNMIKNIAVSEKYYIETLEFNTCLHEYICTLLQELPYPLIFTEDPDFIGLYKYLEIRFDSDKLGIMDILVDYMEAMESFLGVSCFVFVNIKTYLESNELQTLYKEIRYRKKRVLLLESTIREDRFQDEVIRIIDKDLCEIGGDN